MTQQPLDLDQIEARAAAATPGPWHLTDSDAIVAPLTTDKIADVWEPTQASRNGEFIEAARTDVPAMAAEIRRLRAELATANARLDATARLAGRQETKLRDLGAPATVDAAEVHVVADDSDDPEAGTRLCGYAADHNGHEWTSRPDVWCPGYPAATSAAARP